MSQPALGARLTLEERERHTEAMRKAAAIQSERKWLFDENNSDRTYWMNERGERVYKDGGTASPPRPGPWTGTWTGDTSSPRDVADTPDDLFRRWTMAELLAADRTFRWQARGLLVDPTYGFIGGERKTLKTYVAMMVALGLSSGTPIFGQFEVDDPGPVVAYVGEGGRVPYTQRLERVAAAMGVNLKDIPFFPSFDVAPIASPIFKDTLKRDLDELDPVLALIDPLYAFHGAKTNASNLYEEGALLSSLSSPCMKAFTSCMVVSHFNKTGTGRGLDRITQVGGQEWSDSWMLLSHRAAPDVANGRFQLLFEVGSRQWGGSTWELDLEVGRFDVELGEFDGAISWDIRRHMNPMTDSKEAKVLALIAAHPYQLTREELAKGIGGNLQSARAFVSDLEPRARSESGRSSGSARTASR